MSLGLRVIAVGRKMPEWVNEAVREYQRRIPSPWRLEWIELAPGTRGKSQPAERAIEEEADGILARLGKDSRVIALDERGASVDTHTLATRLEQCAGAAENIDFIIGGPDGLSPRVRARADHLWSLSALTFPHPLVRVILTEQLYRAIMINQNHPYHRD